MDDYLAANRARWDEVAPQHARAAFYDLEGFRAGKSSLHSIEREELGPVRGKSLLHLQCHFGLDTLSWARLGAKVAGLDFSPVAIEIARSLSVELEIPSDFVCTSVYDAPAVIDRQFDIVFTSYGVLVWLPDLTRWARVIARFLRPGGVFCVVEHHPLLHTLDLDASELRVASSYFHSDQPVAYKTDESYAGATIRSVPEAFEWQHTLSDVVSALLGAGLAIQSLREYPVCTWRASPLMVQDPEGWWRWPPGVPELPLMFSLKAINPT
jgi:SAM-dependent methyltransferase